MARMRFQKHFMNDIKQLLHVYPLDKQTKEGRPFWSLPKRPPYPTKFDPEDKVHQTFIGACACLYANMYKIKVKFNQPRSDSSRLEMAQLASLFKHKAFVPNDQKANEIAA